MVGNLFSSDCLDTFVILAHGCKLFYMTLARQQDMNEIFQGKCLLKFQPFQIRVSMWVKALKDFMSFDKFPVLSFSSLGIRLPTRLLKETGQI